MSVSIRTSLVNGVAVATLIDPPSPKAVAQKNSVIAHLVKVNPHANGMPKTHGAVAKAFHAKTAKK